MCCLTVVDWISSIIRSTACVSTTGNGVAIAITVTTTTSDTTINNNDKVAMMTVVIIAITIGIRLSSTSLSVVIGSGSSRRMFMSRDIMDSSDIIGGVIVSSVDSVALDDMSICVCVVGMVHIMYNTMIMLIRVSVAMMITMITMVILCGVGSGYYDMDRIMSTVSINGTINMVVLARLCLIDVINMSRTNIPLLITTLFLFAWLSDTARSSVSCATSKQRGRS